MLSLAFDANGGSGTIDSASVQSVSSNAELNYGGGNNEAARVKDNAGYNVWGDDWQTE